MGHPSDPVPGNSRMARAVTRKAKLTAGSAVPEKQTDAKPARRASSPGRPARLSREMILEKSMELLVEHSVEGFTLARVADALDTVSMSIPLRRSLAASPRAANWPVAR